MNNMVNNMMNNMVNNMVKNMMTNTVNSIQPVRTSNHWLQTLNKNNLKFFIKIEILVFLACRMNAEFIYCLAILMKDNINIITITYRQCNTIIILKPVGSDPSALFKD